jgi:short-subunit dehydrogenase
MDKVVAITGVAGGIGTALALEFLKRGFEVVGLDLAESGPQGVKYFQCDLTDDEAAAKVFEQVKKEFPGIGYWINNAGIARLGDFKEVSQKDFDLVMAVNFRAQVTATRFWLAHFEKEGRGMIVNQASAAGIVPAGEMSSYVASKHAVVGFTRSLKLELDMRKSPVKLSLVIPGFVETAIMGIGTASGFPEKLRYLISTPESCAKEIADGVLAGMSEITPTISGKVMTSLYRLPFGEKLAAVVYKKSKAKSDK